jgi:hypothetical protein
MPMQHDLQDAAGTLVQAFQKSWYAFLDQVPEILLAILIVAVGLLVSNKLAGFGRKVIERKSQDPLMTNFLTKTIKLVLGVIVVMFAMRVAGLDGIATGCSLLRVHLPSSSGSPSRTSARISSPALFSRSTGPSTSTTRWRWATFSER